MEKKCKCNYNEKHECKRKAKQESEQVSLQEAIDMLGEAFGSLLETVARAFTEAAVSVAHELNSAGFEVDKDKVLADMKWLYSNGGKEAITDELVKQCCRADTYENMCELCTETVDEIARKVGAYEEIQNIPLDEACAIVVETVGAMLAGAEPERKDSWGEVFDDSKLDPFAYCKKVGYRLSTCENAERYKSSDLMRRVNSLREMEAAGNAN